jgi:hypothetical protein
MVRRIGVPFLRLLVVVLVPEALTDGASMLTSISLSFAYEKDIAPTPPPTTRQQEQEQEQEQEQ